MSATVNQLLVETLAANTYDAVSTTIGLVVIVLLLVLLINREVQRVRGAGPEVRALEMGIVPLACAFALVVAARLLQLLS